MKNNVTYAQENKRLSRADRICQMLYWAAIGVIIAQILL